MSMTHREALITAMTELGILYRSDDQLKPIAAAIRAYVEARGLVMAPKVPTPKMVDDARDAHEGEHYLPYSLYTSMLAAAPDPFKDDAR